jgi:hypothetical protein
VDDERQREPEPAPRTGSLDHIVEGGDFRKAERALVFDAPVVEASPVDGPVQPPQALLDAATPPPSASDGD